VKHIVILPAKHYIPMTSEKYKATILTEESAYKLSEDLAESFKGFDIDSGPKTTAEKKVVGVVDDAYYEDGIIVEVTIYDESIIEKMNEGLVSICPTVTRDLNSDEVSAMGIFVSEFPSESVGEVERISE
jgi:hypothetical protein